MSGAATDKPGGTRRPWRLLVLLPGVGLLVGVPFVNAIRAPVFGLPALLTWSVFWVLATSACTAILWAVERRMDNAARPRSGDGGPRPA